MTESVLDIMSGGTKAPGAFNKYSQIGDTISGYIESVEIWDVRNFNTGQTETWDDGTPQKQLRILFQADPGTWTPQGEDDTGMRAHYVKAWNPHLKSLRDGLAASGEKEPKSGAWWSIRYDHDQPNKSGYDTKIYAYQYQPPASDVSQMLGGQQQQQVQAPQQQYQPPQQQQQPQQFQAPQPQQAPAQQQPVAPVAPAQAPMVATPQGQVDPATGELSNFPAPVPAQQPQQPAQQPPQQQAQAPQQVQQQAGVDPWTGQPQQQAQQPTQPQQPASQQVDPNAGMDSQIIKLVRGGIPDNVITQTLGVTAEQVAQIRATLG